MAFFLFLYAISFFSSLYPGYVLRSLPGPLKPDYEVPLLDLHKDAKGKSTITSGCFDQTGTFLGLSSGKLVSLYVLGSQKRKENNSWHRKPGCFSKTFYFNSPVTSLAIDSSQDSMYVVTESDSIVRVDLFTDQQQSVTPAHLSPPFKVSPFQKALFSISGAHRSVVYNPTHNQVILHQEYPSSKEEGRPVFSWKLNQDEEHQVSLKYRFDYALPNDLYAIFVGGDYPAIMTGFNQKKEHQLVLIDREDKKSYRPLPGKPVALVRSPLDPNTVVVGYANGDMEIMYLNTPSHRLAYKDIHPPFLFNAYGTLLIGFRNDKLVMISMGQSAEESRCIEQSVVVASRDILECRCLIEELKLSQSLVAPKKSKKVLTKKNKAGKKKKKNRRRR